MYHPINLPDCPPLERFNDLIRLLLAFGLERTSSQPEAEMKPLFEQYFTDHGFSEAGPWFWGKPVAIRQPLLKLLALPVGEKGSILAAFVADIDLAGRFADGRLRVSDFSADYAALALAGEIVQNCYTRILASDGVPAKVLGMDAALDRQSVLRAYLDAQNRRRDANGNSSPLKVCPGCDGRPPSVSEDKIHEDLDHFFPKSRYPLLAVHLLNLTPLCKDCNQTYKGTKDAIADNDDQVADVHCLHDIFHPYLRPAQPEVAVNVQRLADGQPHIVVEPRQNDAQLLARLHSLLYTLDVNGRWDGDLLEKRVQPELEKLLLHGWQAERDQGSLEINEAKLREGLGTAVATLSRFIGREPGNVAALAYARWLARDEQGQSEWVQVMETAVMG